MVDVVNFILLFEIIVIEDYCIVCDGGGGVFGYFKVFLEMGEGDFVECFYCDCCFVWVGLFEDLNV